MPLTVQCPRCNGSVSIADESAGKRVKCSRCQQSFLAPGVARSSNDDDDWLQLDEPPAAKPTRLPTKVPPRIAPTLQVDPRPTSNPEFQPPGDDFFLNVPDELDEFTSQIESPPLPLAKTIRPEARSVEYATEYRVRCKTCDSLMFVKASQAGKTVKCSDCFAPVTIPPPPKLQKKPSPDIDSAPTFALNEPTTVRRKNTDPYRKSAEQLLEEAAKTEQDASVVRYSDTPSVRQWLIGVFGIFRDLSVITHWVGLSIVAAVPLLFVMAVDKPYFYMMLLPAGLFFGALLVSCGFAILQSVANEEEKVSEWPILDPPSWLGELVVVIAAAGMVAAPIAALCQLLNANVLIGVALTMLAIYGLFPFVLLSMMDMNSPLKPFSPEVARSVSKCEEAWGGFYFSSGLLFAALYLLIFISRPLGTVGVVISVFAAVGVVLIYFAMIGRLAFAIGQAVNTPPRRQDSESTSDKESR